MIRLLSAVNQVLPVRLAWSLRTLLVLFPQAPKKWRAQRAFEAAPETPPYLTARLLEELHQRYPPVSGLSYDPEAVERLSNFQVRESVFYDDIHGEAPRVGQIL